MPPLANRISVSTADEDGLAIISGQAGAVPDNSTIMVKNVSTGNYTITIANETGAFTATLFAPEDSSVEVAWSDYPYNDFGNMHSQPSTQLYVDNFLSNGQRNIIYTLSGLIYNQSSNGTFIAAGTLNDTRFNPGDMISTTVHLRVKVTEGLVYSFDNLKITVAMGLDRMFDAQGHQQGSPNRTFATTLLAPTGLPILFDKQCCYGWHNVINYLIIPSTAISRYGNILETDFVLSGNLPLNLPAGIYRPTISFDFGVLYTAPPVTTIQYAPIATSQQLGTAPYLPVIQVGQVQTPRLTWMLLTNTLSNGSRGAIAQEDKGNFAFVPMIPFQSENLIIPKDDLTTGEPIIYRLEPFMPLIASSEKFILAFPRIPFAFPSGSLIIKIQKPDGTVFNLEPAVIQQSLDSYLPRKTYGTDLVFANPGPGYVYEVTTFEDQFNYQFSQYGRYVITMTGSLSDIWGNQYLGGGTYDVYVARTLDLDLGTMPGTPFEVGDSYAPTVIVEPNIPANVEIKLRQYSGPINTLVMTQTVRGLANNMGYFHPQRADEITFNQPGEYVVDVLATYTDADGVLWMGSLKGASVIETPSTPLVAHGRRGMTWPPEAQNMQWFFLRDLSTSLEGGDIATIGEVYLPYQSGDVYWFVDSTDAQDVLHAGTIAEKSSHTIHDTIGEIAELIDPDGNDTGQMQLLTKAIWPYDSGSFPEFTYIWGYAYSVSQRPGVPLRSYLIETDYTRGYWNSNDPYNLVIGNGTIGDLPDDFKFQYGGAVVRYLGDLANPADDFAEYAIYASGAVMVPRGAGIGNRVTPAFRGASGGPDGGPLLTIKGQDIDIFFHPTGVRPGTILETGDELSVSGAVMPPLGSLVTVTVDSPQGQLIHFSQHANKIGYFYNPNYDIPVNTPGVYTVTVQVLHDGLTSTGLPPYGNNRGDVLNSSHGVFNIYVIPKSSPPLCLNLPHHAKIDPTYIPIQWTRKLTGTYDGETLPGLYLGGLNWTHPALADLDGDGDLDMLVGEGGGTLVLYNNMGSTTSPKWQFAKMDYANVYTNWWAYPTLADVTGDGLLDLIIGTGNGEVIIYYNRGTPTNADWPATPDITLEVIAGKYMSPALADLDNDGNLDLLVGNPDGTLYFYHNTGTLSDPSYSLVTDNYAGISKPGESLQPSFVDLDKDGDLDLLIGQGGFLIWYRNDGPPENPTWTWVTDRYANLASNGGAISPAWGDWDGDGNQDLVLGAHSGAFNIYHNDGQDAWTWTSFFTPFNFPFELQFDSAPALADLDNDQDLDMLIGQAGGNVYQYTNQGNTASPDWHYAGIAVSLPDGHQHAAFPALVDIDGDGDYDLFIGEGGWDSPQAGGNILYYHNDGTPSVPSYTLITTTFLGINVGGWATPTFADIDADGDQDLFIGNSAGTLTFVENIGNQYSPAWATPVYFYANLKLGDYSAPAFQDMDNDGDLDMVSGQVDGRLTYIRNDGSSKSPTWSLIPNLYPDISTGERSIPTFADLNGDTFAELILGDGDGGINLYERSLVSLLPFPLKINGSIPADMHDVSLFFSLRMPEILLDKGNLQVKNGHYQYTYDPKILHKDFRNLDITDINGNPSAVDPVTFNFYATGYNANNQPVVRGRSFVLQGDQLLADISVDPDSLVELGTGGLRPAAVTISQGGVVVWLNCNNGTRQIQGEGWTSGNIPAYSSASTTFNIPGAFPYYDPALPGQVGLITVTPSREVYLPAVFRK